MWILWVFIAFAFTLYFGNEVFCFAANRSSIIMHSHYVKIIILTLFVHILCAVAPFAHAQYPGFDGPGNRTTGGVGLAPVSEKVDGGEVPVGASSQVVVLFRNEGGQAVETGKIQLYPSSNVSANVSLNQCISEPLPAGAECAVAVSVKGLQAGAWRVEMLMLHSGRSRLVTTTLAGTIAAAGDSSDRLASDIEVIPNELNFGALGASHTLVESVILRNITSSPINIEDVGISASNSSGFAVENSCKSLDPGQACLATVKWAPKQKGPSTGVMVINHNGPSAVVSVPLTGDYSPDEIDQAEIFPEAIPGRGLMVSSQTEVNFGEAVISASTITVSLVNIGDTALEIKNIKLSGKDNGLNIDPEGCAANLVLEPVEACPLTLTWSPTRTGELLDDVQILHNGARGILIIPIRGTAENSVSQDQKAIVLNAANVPTKIIDNASPVYDTDQNEEEAYETSEKKKSSKAEREVPVVANASRALDGFRITSFSQNRAIVNGPSGSKLLFNNEPVIIGGVLWDINISKNGIEFAQGEDRVLLLFDRSLSSVNRSASQSLQTQKTQQPQNTSNNN